MGTSPRSPSPLHDINPYNIVTPPPSLKDNEVDLEVSMPDPKCPGGLFSLKKKAHGLCRRDEFSTPEVDAATTEVQFRLSGLDPKKTYTIYIEDIPFSGESRTDDARECHGEEREISPSEEQGEEETRAVPVTGDSKVSADDGMNGGSFPIARALVSWVSSSSRQNPFCGDSGVHYNNRDHLVGAFEVEARTASVRRIKDEELYASTAFNKSEKPRNFEGHPIFNSALISNGTKLIRRVNSSEPVNRFITGVGRVLNTVPEDNTFSQDEIHTKDLCKETPPMGSSLSSNVISDLEREFDNSLERMDCVTDGIIVKKIRHSKSWRKYCECGQKTHRRKKYSRRLVALNIDNCVEDGQCLVCKSPIRNDTNRPRFATFDGVFDSDHSSQITMNDSIQRSRKEHKFCADVVDSRSTVKKTLFKAKKYFLSKKKPNNFVSERRDGVITDDAKELLRPFNCIPENCDKTSNSCDPILNFGTRDNWAIEKIDHSMSYFKEGKDMIPSDAIENVRNGIRRLNSCFNKYDGPNRTEEESNEEFSVNRKARILFVGKRGSGRSSLIHSLQYGKKNDRGLHIDKSDGASLEVHEWDTTYKDRCDNLQLRLWEFTGDSPMDFATQDLLYSHRAFYVLLWDMGVNIAPADATNTRLRSLVDKELERDISKNVLNFFDNISKKIPGASVVPVLTFADRFDDKERKYRISLLKNCIEKHISLSSATLSKPSVFYCKDLENDVICISNSNQYGVSELKKLLLRIASVSRSCHHVGKKIPRQWEIVQETIKNLRSTKSWKACKVKEVKEAMEESGEIRNDELFGALRFLYDIGEIGCFDFDEYTCKDEQILFLDPCCFLDTMKVISRHNLRDVLREMKGNESGSECGKWINTNMPIISSEEGRKLISWNTREDHCSSEIYDFIQRQLISRDLMHEINSPSHAVDSAPLRKEVSQKYFFMPSLLKNENPFSFSYKCKESWKKTLATTWSMNKGISSVVMEEVHIAVLKALQKSVVNNDVWEHETLSPFIPKLTLQRMLGWRDAFSLCIEHVVNGTYHNVEVTCRLVDKFSEHCIGSDCMSRHAKKLILTGKGQAAENDGTIIWEGGYGLVLNTIRNVLSNRSVFAKEEIVCPVCLANLPIQEAASWDSIEVNCSDEKRPAIALCNEGHCVSPMLLTGAKQILNHCTKKNLSDFNTSFNITSLYRSVVRIAVWNGREICRVGSGFIVDGQKGLIITSAHTFMDISVDDSFIGTNDNFMKYGEQYFSKDDFCGSKRKILVGITKENIVNGTTSYEAVYRYCAQIVAAEDLSHVDACVLQIKTKFEKDLTHDVNCCDRMPMVPAKKSLRKERFISLKMTPRCEIEEQVAIIGYRQEGIAGVKIGENHNRSIDFSKGYLREVWMNAHPHSDIGNDGFQPRLELIACCFSMNGYSGGPMVNKKGEVLGIVRSGYLERHECYVVPTCELKELLDTARRRCRI